MRNSAMFQITGKLCENSFEQVQIAYLSLMSYLDQLF